MSLIIKLIISILSFQIAIAPCLHARKATLQPPIPNHESQPYPFLWTDKAQLISALDNWGDLQGAVEHSFGVMSGKFFKNEMQVLQVEPLHQVPVNVKNGQLMVGQNKLVRTDVRTNYRYEGGLLRVSTNQTFQENYLRLKKQIRDNRQAYHWLLPAAHADYDGDKAAVMAGIAAIVVVLMVMSPPSLIGWIVAGGATAAVGADVAMSSGKDKSFRCKAVLKRFRSAKTQKLSPDRKTFLKKVAQHCRKNPKGFETLVNKKLLKAKEDESSSSAISP